MLICVWLVLIITYKVSTQLNVCEHSPPSRARFSDVSFGHQVCIVMCSVSGLPVLACWFCASASVLLGIAYLLLNVLPLGVRVPIVTHL